jgi:hypothetical protein
MSISARLPKPRRLTITVSAHVYQQLLEDSDLQGRSLSNYAAYMLERSLDQLASVVSQSRTAP